LAHNLQRQRSITQISLNQLGIAQFRPTRRGCQAGARKKVTDSRFASSTTSSTTTDLSNSEARNDVSAKVLEGNQNLQRSSLNIHTNASTAQNPIIQCFQDNQMSNGAFNLEKTTKGLIFGHLNVRSIKTGTKFDE